MARSRHGDERSPALRLECRHRQQPDARAAQYADSWLPGHCPVAVCRLGDGAGLSWAGQQSRDVPPVQRAADTSGGAYPPDLVSLLPLKGHRYEIRYAIPCGAATCQASAAAGAALGRAGHGRSALC
uniref:Uncharacterized protein n=1 Tax=Erwinia pyrifoliae TaxID=79967 RepID=D0UJ10_ERWPY|nr:unknown [Erwinia pyrifoliae]